MHERSVLVHRFAVCCHGFPKATREVRMSFVNHGTPDAMQEINSSEAVVLREASLDCEGSTVWATKSC
jgi:hypothetical protein